MFDEIRAEMEAAPEVASDEAATSHEVETPASESVADAPVTTTPEPTDTPPPSDTGVAAEAPKPGPIPFDRHTAALQNARQKAAEEAEAKYRWLQSHGDPQSVQTKLSILQRAEQDPAGFIRDFVHASGIDPRTLTGQAQAPQDAPPDPDVLLDNGQTTYSHARLQELLAWQQRQTEARIQQEVAPFKQQAVVAEMKTRAEANASRVLQKAQALPGMDDKATRAEIASFMKANPDVELYEAWASVMGPRLLEQAKTAEQTGYQKALSTLQSKAGAAAAPTPRVGAAPAVDTSNLSIREALELSFRGEL